MNISMTDKLERFVMAKVEEGTYASQSEVVRAGLRLLIERERLMEAQLHHGGAAVHAAAGMEAESGITSLPPELWAHFPEYRGSGLSLETDRETVIGRLLQVGDLRAAQWLRERVPSDELRSFILRKGAHALDRRALRIWGVLLDLPLESGTAPD